MAKVLEFKPKTKDAEHIDQHQGPELTEGIAASIRRYTHMPDRMWQCSRGSIFYYLAPQGHVCAGCGYVLSEYPNI